MERETRLELATPTLAKLPAMRSKGLFLKGFCRILADADCARMGGLPTVYEVFLICLPASLPAEEFWGSADTGIHLSQATTTVEISVASVQGG